MVLYLTCTLINMCVYIYILYTYSFKPKDRCKHPSNFSPSQESCFHGTPKPCLNTPADIWRILRAATYRPYFLVWSGG